MTLANLIAFNAVLWAAILSPGPALLTAIQTGLAGGRAAGLAVGAGLAVVAASWTLAALLGLDVLFSLFPWAFSTVRLLGACYLLYIAWRMWRGARDPIEAKPVPGRHAFLRGIFVNLLNPKSVLFAGAVLIAVFPADMSPTDNALVVVNHLVVELAFYTMVAIAMSSPALSSRYLRAKPCLDRVAAVILGALGLRLLRTSA